MNIFGFDCGLADYDLQNKDEDALVHHIDPRIDSPSQGSGEWYYAGPVTVSIPNTLRPLPDLLLENPMNMMYFHYFLDYTAKVLVTHECPSNPFKTILPQLALQDANLLRLMLAYAACHRARLLHHAEPVNRIATWVTEVFPTFREALSSSEPISDSVFGTCVMLASLTVSYPLAFDLPISWEEHLAMARRMHTLRLGQGGYRSKAAYFFGRWFAYLDTFGGVSSDNYHSSHYEWSRELTPAENNPDLKCLVGYTNRSLVLLSRVGELAKRCDYERKTKGQPSIQSITSSQQLRMNLELCTLEIKHTRYDCSCSSSGSSTNVFRAVNAALCHAALIYLHRKVYLLASESRLVQFSVGAILDAFNVLRGVDAFDTPDIILPLFLAGCEAKDRTQAIEALQRLQSIENAGMSQVGRVKAVLQDCWDSGKDWIELDSNVFLG